MKEGRHDVGGDEFRIVHRKPNRAFHHAMPVALVTLEVRADGTAAFGPGAPARGRMPAHATATGHVKNPGFPIVVSAEWRRRAIPIDPRQFIIGDEMRRGHAQCASLLKAVCMRSAIDVAIFTIVGSREFKHVKSCQAAFSRCVRVAHTPKIACIGGSDSGTGRFT